MYRDVFPRIIHYEWGARFVRMERTATLGNAQTGIAFMRGAGRQYNRAWGMDISTWEAHLHGTTHFDVNGNQMAGKTASLVPWELIAYFYSGTNYVLAENFSNGTYNAECPPFEFRIFEFFMK